MKKGFLFFRLVPLCLLASQACGKNVEDLKMHGQMLSEIGGIRIVFKRSEIPAEVSLVVVHLSKDSIFSVEDSTAVVLFGDTVEIIKRNLVIGKWIVSVKMKNNLSTVLYLGSDSINVAADRMALATVSMRGVVWKMVPSNPVLKQTVEDQDQSYLQTPCVVKVNDIFKMWYTAGYSRTSSGTDSTWIAEAESPDGITWIKRGRIAFAARPPVWMNKGGIHPAVLFENGTYRMWFTAVSSQAPFNGIGYALSADGLNWVVDSLRAVAPDEVKTQIMAPGIVKVNALYHLFYSALSQYSGSAIHELFLAKSNDAIKWEQFGRMLNVRPSVSWEQGGFFVPSCIFDEKRFKLFYTASGNGTSVIAYAESRDGVSWVRAAQPELQISDAMPWKIIQIAYPSVLRDGWKLKMWFSGLNSRQNHWQIGFAEK